MTPYLSIFGVIPASADSISVPNRMVCEIFSAYILTLVLVVDRDDTDLLTVGRRDVGGVISCFGDPSQSSRLLRGRVPYLSAAIRVAVASAAVRRDPLVGHFFSLHGEFGVRHLAADVLVGFALSAGLSRTKLGRSVDGRILGLGVSGRGFSGGMGFSRLLARSLVARLGPRGAVAGRGVDVPTGDVLAFWGSVRVTLTRRRGRGGAPANEELSEPHPDPQETTLEAHERDPPPLLKARPHPSTPLSDPAAPKTTSSQTGKLSNSPNERTSSAHSFSINESNLRTWAATLMMPHSGDESCVSHFSSTLALMSPLSVFGSSTVISPPLVNGGP